MKNLIFTVILFLSTVTLADVSYEANDVGLPTSLYK